MTLDEMRATITEVRKVVDIDNFRLPVVIPELDDTDDICLEMARKWDEKSDADVLREWKEGRPKHLGYHGEGKEILVVDERGVVERKVVFGKDAHLGGVED